MIKPVVAIVGRPNVGKSTFVNRLVGKREAIVDDVPGVTRDRAYFDVEWMRHEFTVIDTGGIVPDETDSILKGVQAQVRLAIHEAEVIIFIVDGKDGITSIDLDIAQELRLTSKPIVLVVNKIDNNQNEILAADFYELNLGDIVTMSSIHGLGINDVLDKVTSYLPEYDKEDDDDYLKIAIVGRPNVGKSSIINALLGTERVIVSEISGTTRDAIDTFLTYHEKKYSLIDTAGIRRRARVDYGVEQFSVVRSLKAIDRAEAVVMIIDATQGATEQDQKIAGVIDDKGKACLVVVNKWDLIEKDNNSMNNFADELKKQLYFLNYAPILFTSALTKKRLFNIFELISGSLEENSRRITTGLLNQVVNEAISLNPPPTDKGRPARIYYCTQASINPPTFVMFCNNNKLFSDSYKRYLENKIRGSFGFIGTPIRFIFRNKEQ